MGFIENLKPVEPHWGTWELSLHSLSTKPLILCALAYTAISRLLHRHSRSFTIAKLVQFSHKHRLICGGISFSSMCWIPFTLLKNCCFYAFYLVVLRRGEGTVIATGWIFYGLVKLTQSTSEVTIRSYKVHTEILWGFFCSQLRTHVSDLGIIFFWRIQNFFLKVYLNRLCCGVRGRTELVRYNLLQYARGESWPFSRIQTSIVVVMGDMIFSFCCSYY